MKKMICLLLALTLCVGLCCGLSGCGRSGYGVKTIVTLVEQDYSLAFRTDDLQYYYVVAALEQLNYNGRVKELTMKWFGEDITTFGKSADALERIGMPEPKTFIIGVDINSFPLAYVSNGLYWGFDIELASSVCELLGWELAIHTIEKEDVAVELASGNIDCAWGGIALNENELAKEKYVAYGPYVHNDIVIAARDNSGLWNTLKLNNKNMAMPTTPEATAALETNPKVAKRLGQITRLVGGSIDCFSYLYSGKCDAILTDSTALYYYNSH